MAKEIKFSVTVPAYKAMYLAECIDSILGQTYKNFELIIINDDSPQDLDSIVNKYRDSRIKYYKNNVGFGAKNVVGNWNKCLEYATGDYLICMGDDDKLTPNCLSDYLDLIDRFPGLGVYHTQAYIIDEKSNIINIQSPRPSWESVYSAIYYRWFGNRIQYIGDWLFSVNQLRENGGFIDLPYAWESDDVTVALVASKQGIANTCFPGFMYRVSTLTISNSTNNTHDKLLAHRLALPYYEGLFVKAPNNSYDIYYYNKLITGLQKHLDKQFAIDILADMKYNIFNIFHWLLKKKSLNISNNVYKRVILYYIEGKLNKIGKKKSRSNYFCKY